MSNENTMTATCPVCILNTLPFKNNYLNWLSINWLSVHVTAQPIPQMTGLSLTYRTRFTVWWHRVKSQDGLCLPYIYRHIVNKEAIFLNFQHYFACNFLFLSYIQWLRGLMHMKDCIKWRIWKGPVSIWIEYALDVGLI